MNKRALTFATLPLALTLLAGCQSLSSNSSRLQAGIRVSGESDAKAAAAQQLAEGRAALDTRNYAAAVAAFRNAAFDPALAASAHNGLAVAYAGIGRNDLASRYFRMAITEDPDNPRYQANLARMDAAQQPVAVAADAPVRVAVERRLQGSAFRPSLLLVSPHDRLVRVSATGVLLRSGRAAQPVAVLGPTGIEKPRKLIDPRRQAAVQVPKQTVLIRQRVPIPKVTINSRRRTSPPALITTTAVLIPRIGKRQSDIPIRQAADTRPLPRISLSHGEFVALFRDFEMGTPAPDRMVLPEPKFGLGDTAAPAATLALVAQ